MQYFFRNYGNIKYIFHFPYIVESQTFQILLIDLVDILLIVLAQNYLFDFGSLGGKNFFLNSSYG